jgi:glycosyltransferase involved in cell wall biosynthesis
VINSDPISLESRAMHKRLKVIHIVEDLKVGGLEKVIATIATGLDSKKFDVEIWCLSRGGAVAEWLKQKGVRVRIFSWRTYHNPLNIVKLAMKLRESRVKIVHTHGYYAGTFGRLAAITAGISLVFAHVHTSDFTLSMRNRIIEKVLSFFTRKIICISQHVKGFVESQEGIRPEKTVLVYNGTGRLFEDAANDSLVGSEKLMDDDFVIVSVGSLVENKGHHVLIESVRMLCSEKPPFKVLIAGDGPQRSVLQDYVDRCGLSSTVMFVGVVKDVRQVLRAADIFVLPTVHREGLSLAVLEAMQHGLPVIASRIGGVPELVDDGVTGILVTPNDPRILARAIRTLADDKKLRCQMGESGGKKVDRLFRAERMIAQIESLYEST